MRPVPSRSRPAFTLVELLTVVAIIVLLISILVPAVQSARTQAKQTTTSGLLKSLATGCEMFKTDFKRYPQSRGYNPFEENDVLLFGAQWLALQLLGADMRGYVAPDLRNDADGNGVIDHIDWRDWYALPANRIDPDREYTRNGPYADVDAKHIRTIKRILQENPDVVGIPEGLVGDDDGGSGGSSEWNTGRLAFFVDAWEYPVLYYAANPQVDEPFTTGTPTGDFVVGRYDQCDNAAFTGSDGGHGRFPLDTPGWDLTGTAEDPDRFKHPLGEFRYERGQTTRPEPGTFEGFVYNEQTFESTRVDDQGRIWPHNPDSFLLISTGPDGRFGTTDDVTNFER